MAGLGRDGPSPGRLTVAAYLRDTGSSAPTSPSGDADDDHSRRLGPREAEVARLSLRCIYQAGRSYWLLFCPEWVKKLATNDHWALDVGSGRYPIAARMAGESMRGCMAKVSGRGVVTCCDAKSWFQKWYENVAWSRATGKPVRRALLAASIVELFRRPALRT